MRVTVLIRYRVFGETVPDNIDPHSQTHINKVSIAITFHLFIECTYLYEGVLDRSDPE